ncbi:MAG: BamA/TamA family outer membrane protein [Parafilimonas sp.]
MKLLALLSALLFFFHITIFAQDDSLQLRVVLIGDAGDLQKGRQYVVSAVKNNIKFDAKTKIVFLGDNLYTTGLPDDSYKTYALAKAVLDSQVNIAKGTPAKVYFIPGNHDWNKMRPGGWDAIVREQQYIDLLGDNNVKFYPEDGCPGPIEVSLSNDVVLIIIDSEWWLYPYDKPGIESDCGNKTKEEVLNQLDNMLSRNSKKLVLFACHHPLKSYGIHGGYYTWKQHLFPFTDAKPNLYIPLPVIGSIYPITRGVFGTAQDLSHPAYQNMIRDLQRILKNHSNVILIAGHEHNLQLIKDSSNNYSIISGAGTHKTRVSSNKHELYHKQANGFATLEISKNKNVNFNFYEVYGDSVKHAYDSSLVNFSTLPKDLADTAKATPPVHFEDSVIIAANDNYNKASGFKRFILGDNYRKEWATPVHLKQFDINTLNGGFKIMSLGGGSKTKSLRLQDKTGKEFTLRSINKDPENAIPENLRNTIAQDMVQDMVSASNPYAPLVVPPLATALQIPAPSPTFYYIPEHPGFGIYDDKFKKNICLLEERNPIPSGSDSNTRSTAKVISKLFEDNDNRVIQEEVLRARLLDMLIGDWNRHFDQWRWGTFDTGKGKVYYTIPRDRDEAFFYSDGLLIKIVSMHLLPFLKGFQSNIQNIKWFNWEEKDFDRLFLNQLNELDWQKTITLVQQNITDSIITNAVHKMPPEIVAIDGDDIIKKLKDRRDILQKEGLKYYNFLSRTVNIVGSNKKEYFHVSGGGNQLQVNVYGRKKGIDTASLMYSRTFNSHQTKEIRLWGLNNDDIFKIDSNANAHIKLRIIGGKGDDTFNINGQVSNYIYDLNTEKNYIVHESHSKNLISSDPNVNAYSATGFKYNIIRFPRLDLGYNVDDGLLVGFGLLRRTYSFRKEPFATQQKLLALNALNNRSYQFKYEGEFIHAIGKEDVLLKGEFINPVLNNFFGLGNETQKDAYKNLDFYRVRYKYIEGNALIRKRFNDILHVSAGPMVYHYWNKYEDNAGRILAKPSQIGLDSANIYSQKTYIGGKIDILINNLDNVLLPTRGINWLTEFTSLGGLTKTSKPFTSLTTDMAVHAALTDPAKIVAVLKVGAGHIYSKHYEYFQALNLGANNFLRGFRKDRFSGNSLFYSSVEIRIKLFESNSYLFPGPVGFIAFNDFGRVWLKQEDSKKWHDAYGAGLYYAAYNYVLISAAIAFSPEEKLFNFSLGTKFNITF